MTIGRGDLQVVRDKIEFETTQRWEITASEKNRIDTVNGEGLAKQMGFVGEEADIEADVMSDEDGSFNEVEKVGKDLRGTGRSGDHLLRDAGELDDEGRQTAVGIHQALKRVDDLTVAQSNTCYLDDAIGSRSQAGCFGIEHDKFDVLQGHVRAAPGGERPLAFGGLLKKGGAIEHLAEQEGPDGVSPRRYVLRIFTGAKEVLDQEVFRGWSPEAFQQFMRASQ